MTLSSASTAHLLLDARPRPGDGKCQGSAGATVQNQPDQVSKISRSRVKDQVTPERRASPETRHHSVPPGRTGANAGQRYRTLTRNQTTIWCPRQESNLRHTV